MTEQSHQLYTEESEKNIGLVSKFEDMFDGAWGTWNTTPLYLYLLHFTLNTTPPPDRKPSPKHAAAVDMASSGKSNKFSEWNKR